MSEPVDPSDPGLDPELEAYLFSWHWSRPQERQEAITNTVLKALKSYLDLIEQDLDLAAKEGRYVSVRYIAHRYGLVSSLVSELEMADETRRDY